MRKLVGPPAVVALVFLPAIAIQAFAGLRGRQAQAGIILMGAVLAALATVLFCACHRLAHRLHPQRPATKAALAAAIGLASTGAAALAFVPLALLLRLLGYVMPTLRYTLASQEQFLYAVALHPATGIALVVLALLACYWAFLSLAVPANVGSASSSSSSAA